MINSFQGEALTSWKIGLIFEEMDCLSQKVLLFLESEGLLSPGNGWYSILAVVILVHKINKKSESK